MKIELSVDSHQLSSEVSELVKNLGPEQKQVLATQLLAEAFKDVNGSLDRAYIEGKVLDKVRLSRKEPELSLEKAKGCWEWNERHKEETSIRTELVRSIIKEVVSDAKRLIAEEIKKDEKVQQVIADTLETVKAEFPNYVKNAMTMFLASQMESQMSKISTALMNSENSEMLSRNLDQRLLNKGI